MIQLKVFYNIYSPEDRWEVFERTRMKWRRFAMILCKSYGISHRQLVLSQEREGMWSRALTYLASILDHVGFIQTKATVSRFSEKTVYLFR